MTHIDESDAGALFEPLALPCGVVLKNRIVKSAMSDSLGDGQGDPTEAQVRLYERWALGGVGAAIIGEVQGSPAFAEKPGNLVLHGLSRQPAFETLARRGSANGAQLWLQLGHAGAMAHAPISRPKGPSAIEMPGLSCAALTLEEVQALPAEFARTASLARQSGFGGVQIHAAHGFLLSQFLSPLFNRRRDDYGGSIDARMRLLLEVVTAVRNTVDERAVVAVKLNATDQLEGGLEEEDALAVVAALEQTGIDLIDVSGGTYFPGAKSASDRVGAGPYFIDFAARARSLTTKPLMVTGGFKRRQQVVDALTSGRADLVGLARALALDPSLAERWRTDAHVDPVFPRFSSPPEGAVTAWYTMRLTEIGENREEASNSRPDLMTAVQAYAVRDRRRVTRWLDRFGIG